MENSDRKKIIFSADDFGVNELATAKAREAVLKNQVDTLQTQQGVDDEIRSKFNVSKAGEKVAMIVNSVDAKNTLYPLRIKSLQRRKKD